MIFICSESTAKMRFRLRKQLFIKRNKVCDYSLTLALIGLILIVIDSELTANPHTGISKVSLKLLLHITTQYFASKHQFKSQKLHICIHFFILKCWKIYDNKKIEFISILWSLHKIPCQEKREEKKTSKKLSHKR